MDKNRQEENAAFIQAKADLEQGLDHRCPRQMGPTVSHSLSQEAPKLATSVLPHAAEGSAEAQPASQPGVISQPARQPGVISQPASQPGVISQRGKSATIL